MNDPIVAEIREHRMKILESYDWDFRKMSRDVMKRQFESGHKVVSFEKRTPLQGAAPNAYAPKNDSACTLNGAHRDAATGFARQRAHQAQKMILSSMILSSPGSHKQPLQGARAFVRAL